MVMKRPALEMSDDHSRRSHLDNRTILQFKIDCWRGTRRSASRMDFYRSGRFLAWWSGLRCQLCLRWSHII